MAWVSLNIQANDDNAEAISDALMALGALSASITDANADTDTEQAIFGEPGDPPPGIWQNNIVSAMFEASIDIKQVVSALQDSLSIPQLNYATETIEEQDWVRATQSQFDPIQITQNLWIVPSWHDSPDQDAINIVLDPGLAFGTGSHPTTHLCLEWLSQQPKLNTVLDYGCGSGILAIAAKKLGAKHVVGVDIDEQAIIASQFNADQNNTSITFHDANDFAGEAFDIVIANILSSALMVLAPALAKYCKTGGNIALSGILEDQVDALLARYSEWFKMDTPVQKDAWILLTGTKK